MRDYKIEIIPPKGNPNTVLLISVEKGTLFQGDLDGTNGPFLRIEGGAVGLYTMCFYREKPVNEVKGPSQVANYKVLGKLQAGV